MRSIQFGTLAALIFAGCALPPCFYSCPLVDPAQCGCGPRVPYCTSPPGCGAFGAADDHGRSLNDDLGVMAAMLSVCRRADRVRELVNQDANVAEAVEDPLPPRVQEALGTARQGSRWELL